MAGNPEYQNLDPMGVPSPITPAASPADPAGYAMVTPHGQGPAPYNIQAPMEDLSAVTSAAGELMGAGIVYGHGPRQAEAAALLNSPQGTGEMDITAGFAGGGDESWPADPSPVADPDNGGYGGA